MARRSRQDGAAFTVRTVPEHRDVIDGVADHLGVSRSDFVALMAAEVFGLARPVGKPAITLDLASLPGLADEVITELREKEAALQETA